MKRSFLIYTIISSFAFAILTPHGLISEVFAQTGGGIETIQTGANSESKQAGGKIKEVTYLVNPLEGSGITSIPTFFLAIINILLVFAIPFVVFFIIYAGFMYVTARGNPEAIKKAHMALLYALIGGMLILGSRILLDIITNTVNQIT